jgi:acetyl-CoA carboxylase carboxyl transferase subunit alpha
MGKKYLDFEKPLEEIDRRVEGAGLNRKNGTLNTDGDNATLKQRLSEKTKEIFANLTDWQIVQLARHPDRPHTLDYVKNVFDEFVELHGDRHSGDDTSIVTGIGKFRGIPVVIVGHQKGRDVKENLFRKFGMAHPSGYRKSLRIMKLAEKLHLPVISFIDTPGANPDIKAEEDGQALVIAENLFEMSKMKTPILCIVIGEGGSGGALGIGVGDRVLMQEYSIYSVISPEGCASILWKNQSATEEAARALKLTAKALLQMGIIDAIIPEPLGGAHRDWKKSFNLLSEAIDKNIKELKTINTEELVELRYHKYRKMGVWTEEKAKNE